MISGDEEDHDRRLMHIESHITDDSQAQPEISANQAATSRWESSCAGLTIPPTCVMATAKPVQVLSCKPRLKTTVVPKGDQDAGYVQATRETEGELEEGEFYHLDVDERCCATTRNRAAAAVTT